jgi:hypothetical protein
MAHLICSGRLGQAATIWASSASDLSLSLLLGLSELRSSIVFGLSSLGTLAESAGTRLLPGELAVTLCVLRHLDAC